MVSRAKTQCARIQGCSTRLRDATLAASSFSFAVTNLCHGILHENMVSNIHVFATTPKLCRSDAPLTSWGHVNS